MTSDPLPGLWIGALGAGFGLLGGMGAWLLRRAQQRRLQALQAAHAEALDRLSAERAEALRRRDELQAYDEVLALNPRVGHFLWRLGPDRLDLSPHWTPMLGGGAEDRPASMDALRLRIHPADLDGFDEALNAHLQRRQPVFDRELRLQHALGHWHWMHWQGKAVTPPGAEVPDRIVGHFYDLHAQKLAEETLASDRRLFDSGPVIVASLDAQPPYRLRSVSASAAEALGHPRGSKLVGRRLDELLLPEDLPAVLDDLAGVLGQPGASFQREVRLRLADGGSHWHSLHAVMAGAEGQTVRAYLLDVERLKQAEREAARQAGELQVAVEHLTLSQGYAEQLRELSEMIQFAASEAEAHGLLTARGPRLLPGWSAALMLGGIAGQVERRAAWGPAPAAAVQGSAECWALRLSKPHAALHGAGACAHVEGRPAHSLCLPIAGLQGGPGVLQLSHADRLDAEPLRQAEARAAALVETLRLSLSNLQLRLSLQEQATRDWMTGLYNRRHFEELLPRELNRALRAAEPLALAMLDIDHFKSYNDRFGHEAGDEVIRCVARHLAEFGRPYDSRCRVGGEELCILMPRIAAGEARSRLEALRGQIAASPVHHAGRELPPVTVSIGVAEAADGGGPAELMRRADLALYAAKRGGRDRIVVWTPDLAGGD